LEGVVKQAMLNASGHLVLPEFLPEHLQRPTTPPPTVEPGSDHLDLAALVEGLLPREDGRLYEEVIAAVERVLFTRVLRYPHGRQAGASELLGLNRSTLRHRLRTLGLTAREESARGE